MKQQINQKQLEKLTDAEIFKDKSQNCPLTIGELIEWINSHIRKHELLTMSVCSTVDIRKKEKNSSCVRLTVCNSGYSNNNLCDRYIFESEELIDSLVDTALKIKSLK